MQTGQHGVTDVQRQQEGREQQARREVKASSEEPDGSGRQRAESAALDGNRPHRRPQQVHYGEESSARPPPTDSG